MCLAVPGKVVSLSGDDPWTRTAKVSFGGVIKDVNMAYVPDVKVDEYVIVHAGFALSQVDEVEAVRMFEELSKLADELEEGEVLSSGVYLTDPHSWYRGNGRRRRRMKFMDEYRDPAAAEQWLAAIRGLVTRPWTLMEVCGGQTHAILKYGIDELLPPGVTLLHGPGCPVCVTPLEKLDRAVALASRPDVIFCSFGDMLRVPGTDRDLLAVKAAGGDVRIVYSPLDALTVARQNPDKQVIFFAVGFETTAPGNAMAVFQARREGLRNFSILVSHVLVPPALEAILGSPACKVQGFLAAGHVCAVMGYSEYLPIAERYKVPIVVTGFEPLDILQGIYMCLKQLEEGRAVVENQYSRVVSEAGNRPAQSLVSEVFGVVNRAWRGIGEIPQSGLGLREAFAEFDAECRFDLSAVGPRPEPAECIAGLVLQGLKKPNECSAFGSRCTPEHPLGATMVSSEGACAAYYRHRRVATEGPR